ncbi:DISARM system SNF2-like helicase DrmD [Kitasatospora purpeofusca]|uniref:DISARM system SNF2-like helicase DrmD n=1 Tax=Kitasatospora purpeofusca TaxID=67352 RepID=UPI00386453DA|nr:DISARM system SNF2-like helicase DrmD [Kitasatospora purpeofusca]
MSGVTEQAATSVSTEAEALPQEGQLVRARGDEWVVSRVIASPEDGSVSTLVELQSVMDGRYGESLSVIWEIEPGRAVRPRSSLPEVRSDAFDPPQRLAAFLDAVRWSAVTSADTKTLQAPFRSGVAVENYQLEPVARAVDAPRVNLLLADDVGLGKTVEAGLVAQELLLRHRARRVLIVCPAGLTLKWRDEMKEKFGLDFTIIDAGQVTKLRRSHGSGANPFRVYPLAIVSLPWLRGPKAQRLLDEVLPPDGPSYPRTFDLLILDEAHHVAPAAPKQVYAVDSQQTRLIRRLAPHFEHRLFLSATPHNGYQASFTALLELIDDQRFARGMDPDPQAQRDTVVRRLKTDVVDEHGEPRFPKRETKELPVEYPANEREVHALLSQYSALRRKRIAPSQRGGRKAADLVTLLLKKRLFSSPRAFKNTVTTYLETARTARPDSKTAVLVEEPLWIEDFHGTVADLDDEQMTEAEDDALDRAGRIQPAGLPEEIALLERMRDWGTAHDANPDAKARELITYLKAICLPDGKHWTNNRVIVFTEYRDTQDWLVQMLTQEGLAGDRLVTLHGGKTAEEREELRLAFQTDPAEEQQGVAAAKVRILIATDAASEGIDLQDHCHRLVNFDIPFNPNKLEQRIGRIDRYGQSHTPQISHFVGVGWEHSTDSYEADLEFLSRIARKVGQMEEDLGSVNAVLSDAVQRRLVGEINDFDVEHAQVRVDRKRRSGGNVPAERDVTAQVLRLRKELDDTASALGITPAAVERVVSTALSLGKQQPLRPVHDDALFSENLFEVGTLTRGWMHTVDDLADPVTGQLRPITFDAERARGRRDVVLAHLAHPLVAQSTRLLQKEMWSSASKKSGEIDLNRVTAVVSDDPSLESVLVGAYARYVLVGADGVRLHEEVLHAGGWVRDTARPFARLENLGLLSSFLDRALTDGFEAAPALRERLVASWPRVRSGLVAALEWRQNVRLSSLENKLEQRRASEQERITANLEQFAASLRAALAEDDEEDALFSTADLKDARELKQWRDDRKSWDARLKRLDAERDQELAAIAARYQGLQHFLFPAAVVFVVPKREAVR